MCRKIFILWQVSSQFVLFHNSRQTLKLVGKCSWFVISKNLAEIENRHLNNLWTNMLQVIFQACANEQI